MTKGTWPPPEYLDFHGWHWLHAERSSMPSVCEWMGNAWYPSNEIGPVTPIEMRRRGWEYLGPVTGRPHSAYLDT
jgi:uncharacterized protein (DUF427 family)